MNIEESLQYLETNLGALAPTVKRISKLPTVRGKVYIHERDYECILSALTTTGKVKNESVIIKTAKKLKSKLS